LLALPPSTDDNLNTSLLGIAILGNAILGV
jgi:hypothetical protein